MIFRKLQHILLFSLLISVSAPAQAYWGQETLSRWSNSITSYIRAVKERPAEHKVAVAVGAVCTLVLGIVAWKARKWWNAPTQPEQTRGDAVGSDERDDLDEGEGSGDEDGSLGNDSKKDKDSDLDDTKNNADSSSPASSTEQLNWVRPNVTNSQSKKSNAPSFGAHRQIGTINNTSSSSASSSTGQSRLSDSDSANDNDSSKGKGKMSSHEQLRLKNEEGEKKLVAEARKREEVEAAKRQEEERRLAEENRAREAELKAKEEQARLQNEQKEKRLARLQLEQNEAEQKINDGSLGGDCPGYIQGQSKAASSSSSQSDNACDSLDKLFMQAIEVLPTDHITGHMNQAAMDDDNESFKNNLLQRLLLVAEIDDANYEDVLADLSMDSINFIKNFEDRGFKIELLELANKNPKDLIAYRVNCEQNKESDTKTTELADLIAQAINTEMPDSPAMRELRGRSGFNSSSSDSDEDASESFYKIKDGIKKSFEAAVAQLDQGEQLSSWYEFAAQAVGFGARKGLKGLEFGLWLKQEQLKFMMRRFRPQGVANDVILLKSLVTAVHGTFVKSGNFGGVIVCEIRGKKYLFKSGEAFLAAIQKMANDENIEVDVIIPEWTGDFVEAHRIEAAPFIANLVECWYKQYSGRQISSVDFIGHSEGNSVINLVLKQLEDNRTVESILPFVRVLEVCPTKGAFYVPKKVGVMATVRSDKDVLAGVAGIARFQSPTKKKDLSQANDADGAYCNFIFTYNGVPTNHVTTKFPALAHWDTILKLAQRFKGQRELMLDVNDESKTVLAAIRKGREQTHGHLTDDQISELNSLSGKNEENYNVLYPGKVWEDKNHSPLTYGFKLVGIPGVVQGLAAQEAADGNAEDVSEELKRDITDYWHEQEKIREYVSGGWGIPGFTSVHGQLTYAQAASSN